jgi:hypothetical protein
MPNAKHDANRVPSLIGVSSTDGETPVPIEADPITRRLLVNSTLSGTLDLEIKAGTLSNGQATIDSTTDLIIPSDPNRQGVIIANQGNNPCYIGDASVSSANGFLLNPGESVGIQTNSAIYGVTSSGATTIGYIALN